MDSFVATEASKARLALGGRDTEAASPASVGSTMMAANDIFFIEIDVSLVITVSWAGRLPTGGGIY